MCYTGHMDEGRYTNLILEEMRDQMKVVIELATTTNDKVDSISHTVDRLVVDVAELKSDMKVVKQAVIDTNTDLKLLERRVTKLEEVKV